MTAYLDHTPARVTPIWLVIQADADGFVAKLPDSGRAMAQSWARTNGFRGEAGRVLLIPSADGGLACVLLGLGARASLAHVTPYDVAGLPQRLPSGAYQFADLLSPREATTVALGWGLGAYRYERYKQSTSGQPPMAQLVLPSAADSVEVRRLVDADALCRDLINTPAVDLTPADLAQAVARVGAQYGAQVRTVVGDELLTQGFPLIHAVGRAAAIAPRLIDLRWGNHGPQITIIGKGVCFDSGGLDLKPAAGMALMKKDMGGGACALSLGQLIMDARLPVRLRLLIPAVENSVSATAMRPGDVIKSRKGLTVEVNNTDAEGRLVLADALAFADEERPDLIVDLATLTGAARVALGAEIPAVFASSATLSAEILEASRHSCDPLWELPMYAGYEDELSSKVADLSNVSASSFAGSIIGALFLRRFVSETTPWLHLDLYAWNAKERAGRALGAEMQAVRALWQMLRARYTAA